MAEPRGDRLQIMLTNDELILLDDWRFSHRMPSRSAAVRELLRRGLAAEGFQLSDPTSSSKDYGVRIAKSANADGVGLDGRGNGKGPSKDTNSRSR